MQRLLTSEKYKEVYWISPCGRQIPQRRAPQHHLESPPSLGIINVMQSCNPKTKVQVKKKEKEDAPNERPRRNKPLVSLSPPTLYSSPSPNSTLSWHASHPHSNNPHPPPSAPPTPDPAARPATWARPSTLPSARGPWPPGSGT